MAAGSLSDGLVQGFSVLVVIPQIRPVLLPIECVYATICSTNVFETDGVSFNDSI